MCKANCPNCGAPIDPYKCTCPYCGTFYKDIGDIPIGKPFYLRLNIGTEDNPKVIVTKVITDGVEIIDEPQSLFSGLSEDGMLLKGTYLHNCKINLEFLMINNKED